MSVYYQNRGHCPRGVGTRFISVFLDRAFVGRYSSSSRMYTPTLCVHTHVKGS